MNKRRSADQEMTRNSGTYMSELERLMMMMWVLKLMSNSPSEMSNACPIGHARETNSVDQDCRDPRQELDWTVHRRHPSPGAFEITRTAYRSRLVTDGIRREEIPRARE